MFIGYFAELLFRIRFSIPESLFDKQSLIQVGLVIVAHS